MPGTLLALSAPDDIFLLVLNVKFGAGEEHGRGEGAVRVWTLAGESETSRLDLLIYYSIYAMICMDITNKQTGHLRTTGTGPPEEEIKLFSCSSSLSTMLSIYFKLPHPREQLAPRAKPSACARRIQAERRITLVSRSSILTYVPLMLIRH